MHSAANPVLCSTNASCQPIRSLTDDELHSRTITVAKREQEMTLVTIKHLHEVYRRRLHLARGFGSIFEYAVKALGFSEPAAAERVAAMRLMDSVPETEKKLEAGVMTLSTAAAVQRFIRREEKETDQRLSLEQKQKLVDQVSGQSVRQAAVTLMSMSASPEAHQFREQERLVAPRRTELRFFADPSLMQQIERVRELKGQQKLEEIFSAALGAYLDKIDPVKKADRIQKRQTSALPQENNDLAGGSRRDAPAAGSPAVKRPGRAFCVMKDASRTGTTKDGRQSIAVPTRTSELSSVPTRSELSAVPTWASEFNASQKYNPNSRYIPAHLRRAVHQRSHGRCEYLDPRTNRRCESRHQLQVDHCYPFALGGQTTHDNLRHLCQAHNALAAIRTFGERKMRLSLPG